MSDRPDSTAVPIRVIVVSDTERGARRLADRLATRETLVTEPVAGDCALDAIDAGRVDCVVGDHTRTRFDDSGLHERILDRTDVVYVPIVDFEDWNETGTYLADENTIPLPKPPSDQFEVLGEWIRTTVHSRGGTGRRHHLGSFLWELTDDLIEAPTQDAIVERVCKRLIDSDHFSGAWICDPQPEPAIRAREGIGSDRIHRFRVSLEGETETPWTRAATERTVQVYPGTEARRDQGASGQFDTTLISVPLLHRGIVYGVLNVTRDRPETRTDLTARVESLARFGKTIGQTLATAEIQAQGETVQQAIEQADPAIAILDEDGAIEYVNAAFESVYGYAKSEAIGATVALLLPDTVDPETLLSEVREETPWREEIVKHNKDGHRFYADLSVATVPVEGGTRRKYVAVASDITSLKKREQRLEVLNRVLRHNLRNDMTAVNGYAELLAEESAKYRDYAVRIRDTANDLVAVSEKAREIEDVVAASQGEHTAFLSTVVSQAVGEVRDAYPDCTVEVSLPDEDPTVDEPVLTSVLRELITNGLEHNDAEPRRVTVEASVRERDSEPIDIRVRDNGSGIPDHELVPIREETETPLEHGSGLGLWLVRWGVTTMNGHVEFADNEPRGTSVTIRLPRYS